MVCLFYRPLLNTIAAVLVTLPQWRSVHIVRQSLLKHATAVDMMLLCARQKFALMFNRWHFGIAGTVLTIQRQRHHFDHF